jgi:hypothetical protein
MEVLDSRMAATLYQPFRDIGAKVVEVSVTAAKGGTLPEKINMPALVLDKALAQKINNGEEIGLSIGALEGLPRSSPPSSW